MRGVEGTRASHYPKGGNDLNFNFESTKSPTTTGWKSEGGEYPPTPYGAEASYSNVSLGGGVDGQGRAFYGSGGRDYQQLGASR